MAHDILNESYKHKNKLHTKNEFTRVVHIWYTHSGKLKYLILWEMNPQKLAIKYLSGQFISIGKKKRKKRVTVFPYDLLMICWEKEITYTLLLH